MTSLPLSNEIQFELTLSPPLVTLTPFSAGKLGFSEELYDPIHNPQLLSLVDAQQLYQFSDLLRGTSPGQPVVEFDCQLNIKGETRWHRVMARATWSADDPPRYLGAIGKAMDVHDSRLQLDNLERIASTDPLTGLSNHTSARQKIENRLRERPDGHFALVIFDLDFFKSANDSRGHLFGDQLLTHLAGHLRHTVRGGDIVARVGGDEFRSSWSIRPTPRRRSAVSSTPSPASMRAFHLPEHGGGPDRPGGHGLRRPVPRRRQRPLRREARRAGTIPVL